MISKEYFIKNLPEIKEKCFLLLNERAHKESKYKEIEFFLMGVMFTEQNYSGTILYSKNGTNELFSSSDFINSLSDDQLWELAQMGISHIVANN